MRREYTTKTEGGYVDWLKSLGCVFYAPLTKGDLTDHISGVRGQVQYNNSVVWDDNMGMYLFTKDSSYSPTQGIMLWSGRNVNFGTLNDIAFTIVYTVNVKVGGYSQLGSPQVSYKWINPITIGNRQVIFSLEQFTMNIETTYKVALVRNKRADGGVAYWYFNGSSIFSHTYPSGLNVDSTVNDIIYANLCNSSAYTGCQFYMKDAMIFNRALTAQEVAQL